MTRPAPPKRRRRKRGAYPDPARRVLINERVCEGCGDCSEQSHCLSVEPLETEFGRKRAINQSSCNKDFSCLKGFCPSFVTVEGGKLRKPQPLAPEGAIDDTLPAPAAPGLARPYGVFIAGVGGTGVVTIGQLLGMAAHIEGRGCSVLDMAGLAQKGGAVYSHVVLAAAPDQLMNTRVAMGEADLVLAGDLVVATSADAMARLSPGRTRVLLNSDTAPTAAFVKNPDWTLPGAALASRLEGVCGKEHVDTVDAAALAVALLGDAIYANPLMMGYAYQKGWLPLSRESLLRAIELNGQQVAANQAAFAWAGARPGPGRAEPAGGAGAEAGVGLSGRHRRTAASARRRAGGRAEEARGRAGATGVGETRVPDPVSGRRLCRALRRPGRQGGARRTRGHRHAAAGAGGGALCFKLMAYKDEYEVARLYSDGEFERRVAQQFEGDWKLRFIWRRRCSRGAARTASRSSAPTARAPCACSACWRGCGACAARASIRSATPPSGAPSASWSGNTTRR